MAVKKKVKSDLWPAALLLGSAALAGLIFGFRRGYISVSNQVAYGYDPDIFSRYYDQNQVGYSTTAISQGISNNPSEQAMANASVLAQMTLDPLAQWLGQPITINSWYRSPALNSAVGGSDTSDHLTGLAADITHPVGNNADLVRGIIDWYIPFDQLIIYDDLDNPSRLHISYDPSKSPRDQVRQILHKTSSGYSSMTYADLINHYYPS